MTIGRNGKTPADVDKLKKIVIGFSNDGNCLDDLDILKYIFKKDVLVLAHLEPEVKMLEKYISVYSEAGAGHLHIQHISKKESVKIISKAKKNGLKITCEVTPHHLYYSNEFENHQVNPPLGNIGDISALRKGLSDGIIDCIASDYAPIPRPKNTGFASFSSFIPLCYGLVLDKTINKKQLKYLISINPMKIINSRLESKL
ncbi:MAG: dihydroorotase [Candidatus Berkelbacteria bacterium Athens1014_28]|uniref:Dihydroorotase n=1 Tax=Candidatus Berkelbacteria bacterium Athens1014_28 TaxID=2017145 RepID=A0A554LKW7_9BACT|nr:MAG: dihydroorotase [Candidatus Berkelbacteria bacterium Athens1014_28]